MTKHTIQVRKYGQTDYSTFRIGIDREPFEVVETIQRKLRAEQIGNFNPLLCTYKGKRTLVHSDEGDISDPFRRQESYLQTLFIKI